MFNRVNSSLVYPLTFVSVDYGNEKGIDEESTMVEVLNFLYENNFELIADSQYRKVGLFKNRAI